MIKQGESIYIRKSVDTYLSLLYEKEKTSDDIMGAVLKSLTDQFFGKEKGRLVCFYGV